jgi:hypothetical protein
MSTEVTYDLEGVEALVAKLDGMTSTARIRKVALKALEPGAKIIKAAIQAEAPVAEKDTKGKYAHPKGALKRGVRYKASRTTNVEYWGGTPAVAAYIIGPFGKGTAHRHLITAGHDITKEKNWAGGGKSRHRTNKAQVLGRTKPNPFVDRGRARSQGAAMSAIESTAHEALEIIANG